MISCATITWPRGTLHNKASTCVHRIITYNLYMRMCGLITYNYNYNKAHSKGTFLTRLEYMNDKFKVERLTQMGVSTKSVLYFSAGTYASPTHQWQTYMVLFAVQLACVDCVSGVPKWQAHLWYVLRLQLMRNKWDARLPGPVARAAGRGRGRDCSL